MRRWFVIPYLLGGHGEHGDRATFIFADKVLYPTYAITQFGGIPRAIRSSIAGCIMWVPGSVFYLRACRHHSPADNCPAGLTYLRGAAAGRITNRGLAIAEALDLLQHAASGCVARWKYAGASRKGNAILAHGDRG